MATKARHKKTAMQLWVVDNRKRLDLEPSDLARATGVSIDTARGWESRGRPSEDAIAALERLFGRPAPEDGDAQAGESAVAAAIDRQTAVLSQLIELLRGDRQERIDLASRIAQIEAFAAQSNSRSQAALGRTPAGSGSSTQREAPASEGSHP